MTEEDDLRDAMARWQAEEPQRRAMRAAIPRADEEEWTDFADALRRDREALALARQSGTLDVDELAEALDNVLGQLHFMARACRNTLAPVPDEIQRLEDSVRPWRRIRRWINGRRPRAGDGRSSQVRVVGYENPLDPPHE